MTGRFARIAKEWAANGLLVIAGAAIGLLLFEAGLRVFSPVDMRIKGDRIELSRMKTIVMDGSKFPKFDNTIVQTRNSLGFRGPNPPNAFDKALTIIAVGGSTTEEYYLSDGKTWPEQLGNHLSNWFENAWVNNAGMDGQTTFGHQQLMTQHIISLRPKVVLFMAGINDRGKAQATLYDENVRPANPMPISTIGRMVWHLSRSSELFALGLNVFRSYEAQRGNLGHGNIDFSKIGTVDLPPGAMEKLGESYAPYLPVFADQLGKLIGISRANGIVPVLLTQTALWGRGIDPTTGRELGRLASEGGIALDAETTVTLNASASWDVLELYNEVIRRVGQETNTFVVDLARSMPKDSKYFYDWMHFTNEGAAKAADLMVRSLCPYLARRFPDHVKSACS